MAKHVVPEAKDALNRFKMEAANEVGVSNTLYFTRHQLTPIITAIPPPLQ